MIEQSSIESLKSTIDVVDVIGNYVELKKTGANYKANCPFHGEKTPSFVVSPSKQIYHCFGCGVGGDAIKFVMEIEHINYPEAIEKLASMYNFSLRYTQGSSDYSEAKRVLELIQKWYGSNMSQNQSSQEYLQNRAIAQHSIEEFGIGFVPDGQQVMAHLQSQHISLPQAVEAGVVAKGEDGRYYARLSQRITFPIYSPNGALVGFGGRTVNNHPAKYINSPQTKLFNKSRLLYGYDRAKDSIYKQKDIIVCEGYLDVIMFHQAGFKTAVATLGTALTEEHLPLLRKGDPRVVLAYDGDKAGIAAAFKAARILGSHGFEGGVVLFPDGQDPADLIAAGQSDKVAALLREAKRLIPFVLESIADMYDMSNPNQKELAFGDMKTYLSTLSPIIKDAYIPTAATILGVSAALFGSGRDNSMVKQQLTKGQTKEDPQWQSIFKTLIETPALVDDVVDVLSDDMLGSYAPLLQTVVSGNQEHPDVMRISIDEQIPVLTQKELRGALLAQLEIYYQRKFKQAMADRNIPFEKKVYIRNKIQKDIIPRLKKGELVAYESNIII
ncbi:MAG: DNA primase [Sulfurovum sp.]|nr:DNA primase [Sulfurovum sp.]